MEEKQFLYPIKFKPILKEKIWGGTKLNQFFNKKTERIDIGESWEISGVKGNVSTVLNGKLKGKSLSKIIKELKDTLVGAKVYSVFGDTFPLLFKFIDASKDLSVQLHPDDALAKERHDSFGKTEMWYILEAESNAKLILGFNKKMNEKLYKKHLSETTLLDILHSEKVTKGDSFFIKPGTVHAIGAGVVLAEIQQTSDITYRIYDYNRPDTNGDLRELHTNLAIKAIDYNKPDTKLNYKHANNKAVVICKSIFFQTNKLVLTKNFERNLSTIKSFVVYMCVDGGGSIKINDFSETIVKGETVLIPALAKKVIFKTTSATFLEVYIP